MIATISTGLRTLLGVALLVGSFWKLYQPYEFLRVIYNYELVGAQSGLILAMVTPWLEFVIGLALILKLMEKGALVISGVLMSAFVAAQSFTLWKGQEITCGCFSPDGEPISWKSVLFSTSALMTVLILIYGSYSRSRDSSATMESQCL